MNVLIIVPRNPISGDHADFNYLFPTSLGFISAALKAKGHFVQGLNLNHFEGSVEMLVGNALLDYKSDVVCTGGLSTAYRTVARIVEAVRSVSSAKVILGGGLISSEPELMCRTLQPDYEVIGEGDETIQELVQAMECGFDVSKVAGIGYIRDGRFNLTLPRPPIEDLDALPWQDLGSLDYTTYLDRLKPTSLSFFDMHDRPRVYPVISSRSCPYSCTFCFHPIGKKYRQRSVKSLMDELAMMVPRHQINIVAIYDELFSHDTARLFEFCDAFQKLRDRTKWEINWVCQLRVHPLDEKTVVKMRESGCRVVSLGFESYSPVVLQSMKKHITPGQIDKAVDLMMKHNISIQGNFIFGDKAETPDTVRITLDYWKQRHDAGISLGYIAPYPGTELYSHCLERGIIKDRLDFIANRLFEPINMSEMTDGEWGRVQAGVAVAEMQYYITAIPHSVKPEGYGTFSVGVECPHCGSDINYGNFGLPFKFLFRFFVYCRKCRRRFYMLSKSYWLAMKLMEWATSNLPTAVNAKLFGVLGRARAWAAARISSGRFNLGKIRKLVQT